MTTPAGPLVFPNGRLLSARWRWLVVSSIALLVPGLIQAAFEPGPRPTFPSIQNPVGIPAVGSLADLFSIATALGILVAFPLAVASAVLRYRRGTRVERQHLRWFAASAGLTTAAQLRDDVGLASPVSDLRNVLERTVAPTSVRLWLTGREARP